MLTSEFPLGPSTCLLQRRPPDDVKCSCLRPLFIHTPTAGASLIFSTTVIFAQQHILHASLQGHRFSGIKGCLVHPDHAAHAVDAHSSWFACTVRSLVLGLAVSGSRECYHQLLEPLPLRWQDVRWELARLLEEDA